VFALFHRGGGDGGVQIVGGTDDDGVEVLLLFKQLAEVAVRRTAAILAGALLSSVMGVHDFLARFAAGDSTGCAERMGQLERLIWAEPVPAAVGAEQFTDRIAKLVRIPLWMVEADFIGITDCYALHVWLPQKVQHDAETLGANPDESNVELVAWRDVIYAAQDPARNDGETRSRRGLRQEFASRRRSLERAARLKPILHCPSLTAA